MCAGLLFLGSLQPLIAQASEDLTVQFIVRDDRHRRIDDLKPEEVQVTEDGKPVTVKSFKFVGRNGSALLSVLVDSESVESLSAARDNVAELLSAAGDQNTQISLWDTKQIALLRDFSSDRNGIASVIASGAKDDIKEAEISAKSKAVLAAARLLVNSQHRRSAYAMLCALIEQQGESAGRKEIVYFAPSGVDGALTEEQIAALGSNALRAGVSVSIVEGRGASERAEAKAAALLIAPQHGNRNPAAADGNKWRELARKTGGLYAAASKDNVRDALHRAGEDLGSYYEATYTPSAQTEDGHFRPVAIKVARPRAVAQHAEGYFSVPKCSAFNIADYEPPMLRALHAGGESDQVRFDSQILHFGQISGKTEAELVVQVPRSALTTVNDEAEKLLKVHFSVYAQIRSADGLALSRFSQDVPYETALEHAKAAPKNLFTFQRRLLLAPGEYRLEVAVADQQAANLGYRSMPFSIAAQTSALTLADVILVQGVEARPPTSGADDPLLFGAQSLVPWAASSVRARKGGELPVLLKVYADAAAPSVPDVQLEILRGGELVANLPLLASGGAGRYQSLVWLPEDSLQPGHYILLAQALQGENRSEQRKEFDYVLPSGASELQEADNGPDISPRQLLSPKVELIAGAKRPSDTEIGSILQAARERALDYKKSLPNFSCLETTRRFTGRTGVQGWKTKDSMTELVRYSDGKEEHKILEFDGVSEAMDRSKVKGLLTKGEFGEFLDAVYSPDAQAEFTWQGRTLVDGREAHVFAYKVKRANSIYSLSTVDGRSRVNSAFQGVIQIDANTLVTHFVSIEAEDIPAQALYRESAVSVNYGYVMVGGQRFLLPQAATLRVRVGKRLLYKDEMQFRNYHRYAGVSNLITQ
jgi:VWFA-related protein